MVLVFKKEENIALPTTIPKICEQYYRSGDHAYATEFQVTHILSRTPPSSVSEQKILQAP